MKDNFRRLKDSIIKELINLYLVLKKNLKLVIPVALILALALGYFTGTVINSKNQFLKFLVKAVDRGDARSFSQLIYYEGDYTKLMPFLEYLKIDGNKERLVEELKINGTYNGVKLKKIKGFLFTAYGIDISPIKVNIKTDHSCDIYINGQRQGTTNGNGELKGISLIPGLYKVEGKFNSEYGEVKGKEKVSLFRNEDITLNLNGNTLTINSPYEKGNVFINGKDTGKKVKDIKNFQFFSKEGKNKMFFTYDYPWGTIKSDEVEIGKNPEVSPNINMINNQLSETLNNVTKDFYGSVFQALNNEDISLIKNVPEELRFNIYSDLTKKYFILKNIYTLNDAEIHIEENSFKYQDRKYSGNIKVTIKYTTSKNILGIPIDRVSEEKTFLTNCEFINNQWKVVSLSKI